MSSYITVNGVTHRLMDYPAWAGLSAAGRAALLCDPGTSDTATMTIGGLSFQKGQVQELILGGDLAGLTTVPNYFALYFRNLAAVDLSGLSNVTSVGDAFLGASGSTSGLSDIDLSPLSKVTSIGQSFLMHSTNLVDLASLNLSALTSLQSVGDKFLYHCNFTVADLRSLTSLKNIGDYFLGNNANLNSVNLSGLTNLESIGSAFLGESANLTSVDLSGLSGLESIGENFLIDKTNLTGLDLSDLTGLRTIGNAFFKDSGNNAAVDLSGLTSLVSIGDSFLSGSNLVDGATISLSGSTLTSIGGSFLHNNQDSLSIDLRGLTAGSIITIGDSFLGDANFIWVNMGTIQADLIANTNSFSGTSGEIRVPNAAAKSSYEGRFNAYIPATRFVVYP
jgi:hypothetical protein